MLLAAVRAVPDRHASAMVIGHNPGMQELAAALAGEGPRGAVKRLAGKFPTGALAVIIFDAARWAEVAPGAGRLDRFVRPRDLR